MSRRVVLHHHSAPGAVLAGVRRMVARKGPCQLHERRACAYVRLADGTMPVEHDARVWRALRRNLHQPLRRCCIRRQFRTSRTAWNSCSV